MLSYDKDQVTLVVQDLNSFGNGVLVITGTLTINWLIWLMKESEIHSALQKWQLAQVACEMTDKFYSFQATLAEDEAPMPTNTIKDLLDLDEKVLLKDNCEIVGFQSLVIWGRTSQTMMMGRRLNVMTQAPYAEDKKTRLTCPMGPT